MVMATPSPQCVGQEFVRQYYTLLNEAPLYLHRFYSNESSFLHGGDQNEEPVKGQADIHKKIMSLGFKDCHAKIRQVDSHATLADGVVVQVTGELSNNGMPMRRFMQTFVLAPQSPKKYYVHNDIFRYQDEVFDEMETDTMEDATIESEMDPELEEDETTPAITYGKGPQPPLSLSNGTVENHADLVAVAGKQPPPSAAEPQPEKAAQPMETGGGSGAPSPVVVVGAEDPVAAVQEEEPAPRQPSPPPPATKVEAEQQQRTEELKPATTWAQMAAGNAELKTSPQSKGAAEPKPAEVQQPLPQRAPREQHRDAPPQPQQAPLQPASQQQQRGGSGGGQQQQQPQQPSVQGGGGPGGPAPPREKRYPDFLQLFVGNLPQDVDEAELIKFFGKWGNVLEMRINRERSAGGRVPNFGFAVFDSGEPVQKILKEKPIFFRDNHRLNVEEKKRKPMGDNPQRPRPNPGANGPGGYGGQGGGQPMMKGRNPNGGGAMGRGSGDPREMGARNPRPDNRGGGSGGNSGGNLGGNNRERYQKSHNR